MKISEAIKEKLQNGYYLVAVVSVIGSMLISIGRILEEQQATRKEVLLLREDFKKMSEHLEKAEDRNQEKFEQIANDLRILFGVRR
ncbi:hypothetical protein EHQ53_14255 [Leptospira langatensis]|uniref:Uncharacterized protein n=1 Tax=Leptospira langatensis TaxID=2484983 RepID=A0ABY2MB42_9LEPT|nr:hypothetical protein [Leptospira langatensis]TGL39680.1 hypothetical protein EHQ53_14255 [Leptospira langatensis]